MEIVENQCEAPKPSLSNISVCVESYGTNRTICCTITMVALILICGSEVDNPVAMSSKRSPTCANLCNFFIEPILSVIGLFSESAQQESR